MEGAGRGNVRQLRLLATDPSDLARIGRERLELLGGSLAQGLVGRVADLVVLLGRAAGVGRDHVGQSAVVADVGTAPARPRAGVEVRRLVELGRTEAGHERLVGLGERDPVEALPLGTERDARDDDIFEERLRRSLEAVARMPGHRPEDDEAAVGPLEPRRVLTAFLDALNDQRHHQVGDDRGDEFPGETGVDICHERYSFTRWIGQNLTIAQNSKKVNANNRGQSACPNPCHRIQ